ncbi:hypothetical protein F0U60_42385 [Archangium minus]|uniref:Uncharacterized protein n=1 Tax=Archangium minus TaxID=83450 RepID=A0ABY9X3Q0_9BACT|nr:hypothetical protein F0U60_42385 [Archangium minus]
MTARIGRVVVLLLGSVLLGMGLGRALLGGEPPERVGPVEWPREEGMVVPESEEDAWVEEGESWDLEEDLGKGDNLVWVPKLGLEGPWRDGRRPLPGGVRLLDELPHGLCEPGICSLWSSLFLESHMGTGEAWAILKIPRFFSEFLRIESNYFETPEIDLYKPRDAKKAKGSKPVSSKSSNPPETAEVSVNMKVLTLCIGLSASACAAVQVRQVDTEWLEDCPKEARVAIEALGLGTGEPYDVELLGIDYTRRQATPLFIKEGPVVARWEGLHLGPDFPRSELGRRMKGAKLFGRAKSYGQRMSIQLDRLELADGRKLPICAIGYDVWGKEPGLEQWGPGSHPGVNVGNTDPEKLSALKDLRPGEFPVANSTIWISFGMTFRPQWLARR